MSQLAAVASIVNVMGAHLGFRISLIPSVIRHDGPVIRNGTSLVFSVDLVGSGSIYI